MAESPDGSDDPTDRKEPSAASGEPQTPTDGDGTASERVAGDNMDDGDDTTVSPPTESALTAGTATDGGTGNSVGAEQPTAPAGNAPVEDGLAGEGPATDEEMPLADHIEEMMRRLGLVFLIAGVALAVVYPFAGDGINYLWSVHIPEPIANRPRAYGPLEFILTKLKLAGLAGLVVGLPMFVYQTYRFMRPGLYPTERRYYLAAVPTSLVLGSLGVLFAHFVVLPFVFAYFTTYTAEAAVIAFGLQETFNLILVLMSWMAIIFQIPLFIMLAIMMNLVTRQWLENKRLLFWGSFLGIAFLFSPDPTGMAPIIVALTMVVLFEGTLALLRWTGN